MFVIALAALAAAPQWVPLNQQTEPKSPSSKAAAAPQQALLAEPKTSEAAVAPTQSAPVTYTPGSGPLALTCLGTGVASKAAVASVWGWGGWGLAAGQKDRGFNEQVDLRLFNGDDRIRMPRTMLPGIHGGNAGWFKLHDVVADARSIRASAGVAMLNNPKVFIDRVTGTISISGKAGDYAGQCQVIDASAPAKF